MLKLYVAHKMGFDPKPHLSGLKPTGQIDFIYPEDFGPDFESDTEMAKSVYKSLYSGIIFHANTKLITMSDGLLAFTDDWDPGVMFEMGFAHGINKPIFSISMKEYGSNIMIQKCVVAHFPKIEIFREAWSVLYNYLSRIS